MTGSDAAYVPTAKGHLAVLTQRVLGLLAETCDECPHHEPAADEATAARIAALLTAHDAATHEPSEAPVTVPCETCWPPAPYPHPASLRLTEPERRVLDAIRDHIHQCGYAPSVREVGAAAGMSSPSTVFDTLQRLADKGAIRRDPYLPRAITILEAAGEATR